MRKVNGLELQKLISKLDPSRFEFSFIEPFTWEPEHEFLISETENGLAFYLLNPYRQILQYVVENGKHLPDLIREFNDNMIIKAPIGCDLSAGHWYPAGEYQPLKLDLREWAMPIGISADFGTFIPKLNTSHDHFISESDKDYIKTLIGSSAIVFESPERSGLCAFRMVSDTYCGIYLANQGLAIPGIMGLMAHALKTAITNGMIWAQTNVETSRKGALFIHQAMGFKPHGEVYKAWQRKSE